LGGRFVLVVIYRPRMSRAAGAGRYGGVFNEVAEEYDRHRPAYPDALVDQACRLGGLGPGATVLEIGCGTGQLTRSLLARGLRVTAIEPGERLIARARDQLGDVGEVEFINRRLEDTSLPRAHYSAVFSASAIHWVDPDVSWRTTADALVDGGTLALMSYFGLQEPCGAVDQQAVRAAIARVAPEVAADWPTYRDLDGTLGVSMNGAATCRRYGRGWGATSSRGGIPQTCLTRRRSPLYRHSWNTRPTRSTLCSARCRSGRGSHPGSATPCAPRTTPSTKDSAGRSAPAPWPAW
jgi:SAM-dependent methyltransferase